MAIEINPKKEERTSLKKNFYYAGITLLVSLITISLVFMLFSFLFSREIPEVDNEIREQKTKEMMDLEKRIDTYYIKTKNLPLIVRNRESTTPFLKIIEESTHPLVFFSEFEISPFEKEVNAKGIARNIVVFDQQIKILKDNESISSFNVPDFDVQEDRTVEFPVRIIFK